jgi:PKHD-type hydroxylase
MDLPYMCAPAAAGAQQVSVACEHAMSPDGRPVILGLEGNDHLQQPFLYERVFTPEQCGRIRELGASQRIWQGRSSAEEDGYRVCSTSWLEETSETVFIYARLRQLVQSVNRLYGLDLAGFAEPLNYICYQAGGHFDWHTDLGVGAMSTRKISVSVQLSEATDYDGGDLEFCPHGVIDRFRGIGNAVAFPAYIAHRVAPVETGQRHALVAWVHGPRYR